MLSKVGKFRDSYYHYRVHVGLGVFGALYRSFYYEIHGGKEPWA